MRRHQWKYFRWRNLAPRVYSAAWRQTNSPRTVTCDWALPLRIGFPESISPMFPRLRVKKRYICLAIKLQLIKLCQIQTSSMSRSMEIKEGTKTCDNNDSAYLSVFLGALHDSASWLLPVSISSPRSKPEKSRLALPPGPWFASSKFSIFMRFAWMKLKRFVHSCFWIPRNRNSCRMLPKPRLLSPTLQPGWRFLQVLIWDLRDVSPMY